MIEVLLQSSFVVSTMILLLLFMSFFAGLFGTKFNTGSIFGFDMSHGAFVFPSMLFQIWFWCDKLGIFT